MSGDGDFASRLSVKQLKKLLAVRGLSSAGVCEKRELQDLVRKHIAEADVDALLNSSTASAPAAAPAAGQRPGIDAAARQRALQGMTPERLRYMAQVMRRDPASARRDNPQVASMSDAEIRAIADQYDTMANNPEQLRAMQSMSPEQIEQAEKMMANLTEEEKAELARRMGNGGGPNRGGGATANTPGVGGHSYADQLQKMNDAMQQNPELCRKMMRNMLPSSVSSELLDKQFEALRSNPQTMRGIINFVRRWEPTARRLAVPCQYTYRQVDRFSGGHGKAILVAWVAMLVALWGWYMVALLQWIWGLFSWLVWGSAASAVSAGVEQQVRPPLDLRGMTNEEGWDGEDADFADWE